MKKGVRFAQFLAALGLLSVEYIRNPSGQTPGVSRYTPHQGEQEQARRKRQRERGIIK